jgi:hypothetical protein
MTNTVKVWNGSAWVAGGGLPVQPIVALDHRLRGANIIVDGAGGRGDWPYLFEDWAWTSWIKYQIDLAVTLGANCIRLIGDQIAILDTATITRATYLAHWTQLLDYCASIGVMVYATASHDRCYGYAGLAAEIAAFCDLIAGYPNTVVAVDLLQEANLISGVTLDTAVATKLQAIYTDAKTRLGSIPATYSLTGYHTGSQIATLATAVDYWDAHLYPLDSASGAGFEVGGINSAGYQTWLGLVDADGRPFLHGEIGVSMAHSDTESVSVYDRVPYLAPQTGCAGFLAWSILDGSSVASGKFGLFTDAGVDRPARHGGFVAAPKVAAASTRVTDVFPLLVV